jgi:hypothetical protein
MTGDTPGRPGPPGGQDRRRAGAAGRARFAGHGLPDAQPGSRVWLVEFDGAPAIVKQLTGGPDARDRYAGEEAALRAGRQASP